VITIPTLELVGLLNDVVAFASADKDDPILRTVHLEWDGQQLHAMATDRYHLGWSRWSPDDPPPEELEEVQEDLFTDWGGDDAPWAATVDLDDAKEAARMFKLPVKKGGWTPLTLDCGVEQLTISRARLGAHTALKQECRRDVLPAGELYPDVRVVLGESDRPDEPVEALAFTACRLASFAKVRVRGPVEMSFAGLGRPVRVRIGNRFDGVILPVRADADNEQLAA
jgi:hypothetical protein